MRVVVVGGAGYIGAHVVRLLQERGDEVVVVDDLSYGSADRVSGAQMVVMDCSDLGEYDKMLAAMEGADAVIHFAARKQVGESMEKPAWYYQQNIGGLALVLQAMAEKNVDKMIFSSSAAVYGMPPVEVVPEDVEKTPINPYGETKLFGETMMAACERANGLKWIGLRYFNVAGAGAPDLGDPAILNLIPMVFERIVAGKNPLIFGDDYPTPDGTCIRDYVHVQDLALAHIEALDYMKRCEENGADLKYHTFNVGTSTGNSVKEVIDMVAKVTGVPFSAEVVARRAGDPPRLIADSTRIREVMGFEPKYDLEQTVRSAWEAWQFKPGKR